MIENTDVKQEAANYLYELMRSKDKSPEMVAAITELLKVVLRSTDYSDLAV